jgi:hypothetical protein
MFINFLRASGAGAGIRPLGFPRISSGAHSRLRSLAGSGGANGRRRQSPSSYFNSPQAAWMRWQASVRIASDVA